MVNMTNEQLCLQARNGDRDALGQLWENVHWLCFKIGRRYLELYEQRGMDRDDLMQDLFLAMCQAVEAYKAEKETKFTAYLNYPIQKRCLRDVLKVWDGKFHEVQTRDIDAPIAGDSETTLGDLIPDPAAEQQFESVEDDIYTKQLRGELERGINILSPKKQEAMRLCYFDGLSEAQAAQRMNVTKGRVNQLLHSGCMQLKRMEAVRAYHDAIISRKAHQGTSYSAWKNTGSSVEEQILIYLEEKEEEYAEEVKTIHAGRSTKGTCQSGQHDLE